MEYLDIKYYHDSLIKTIIYLTVLVFTLCTSGILIISFINYDLSMTTVRLCIITITMNICLFLYYKYANLAKDNTKGTSNE